MNSFARSLGWWRIPLILVAVILGVSLFVLPLVVVVASSWTSGSFVLFPPEGFSLTWYRDVLASPEWMDAFWRSMWISAVATAGATLLGTLGALALTRVGRTAGRIVRVVIVVPIALPPIAYAVGLYNIDRHIEALHGSFATLVIGETLLAMPFVFVIVSGALGRMDPALRKAAASMGARWSLVLWSVELPALRSSILTGSIFAFTVAFDEAVLSIFLSPPGQETLPLRMLNAAQESFSPQLTAASTLVSVLALAVLSTVTVLQRGSDRSTDRKAEAL